MAGVAERCVRAVVTGTVQGVGFRWFAVQRARSLGVAGWVRNRPDGTVEVAARGTPAGVQAFVAALRIGPRAAEVGDVTVTDAAADEEYYSPFDIRHSTRSS